MKLNEYREEIQEIDLKMMELFKKRMSVVDKVKTYKQQHQLPVFDEKREKTMLENYQSLFNDETLWVYFEKVIKTIITVSKDFQND